VRWNRRIIPLKFVDEREKSTGSYTGRGGFSGRGTGCEGNQKDPPPIPDEKGKRGKRPGMGVWVGAILGRSREKIGPFTKRMGYITGASFGAEQGKSSCGEVTLCLAHQNWKRNGDYLLEVRDDGQ